MEPGPLSRGPGAACSTGDRTDGWWPLWAGPSVSLFAASGGGHVGGL